MSETFVSIDSLTLHHNDATDDEPTETQYRTNLDEVERESGTDAGSLLIRLAVDGTYDIISAELGPTADLDALERSIAALSAIRDELTRLYAHSSPVGGRCLAHGDWGRCLWGSGHDGSHHYETQMRVAVEPVDGGQEAC